MKRWLFIIVIGSLIGWYAGLVGIALLLALTVFLFSIQRGRLFVQAALYLRDLSEGKTPEQANKAADDLTADMASHLKNYAKSMANLLTEGNTMQLIRLARTQGFKGGGIMDWLFSGTQPFVGEMSHPIIDGAGLHTLGQEYKIEIAKYEDQSSRFIKIVTDSFDEKAVSRDFKTNFTLYALQANQAALSDNRVPEKLHDKFALRMLTQMGYPDHFASGVLTGFKNTTFSPTLANDEGFKDALYSVQPDGSIDFRAWVAMGDEQGKRDVQRAVEMWKRAEVQLEQLMRLNVI